MTIYNFKRFTGSYPRGDAKITISGSGIIRFSPRFCQLANLTNFTYAVLFYDAGNRAIAIKFTKKMEEGGMKLTKDAAAMTISAISFMKANALFLRSYFRHYDGNKKVLPNIGEVYIVELDKK
jgi:hypothetical protein